MTTNADLRALASRAGSDTWFLHHGRDVITRDKTLVAETAEARWGNYIAAANPARVIQLLDDNENLRADNERLREALDDAHFSIVYRYQQLVAEEPPMDGNVALWRVWHLHPSARAQMTANDARLYDSLMKLRPA